MTQCLNCNSTFVSNEHNFGHSQLYCSTKCANRERHKRYIQKKSAEITENIAIEFAEWLDNNSDEPQFHLVQWTYKSMFQEYLKTKENDTRRTNTPRS